MRVSGTRRRAGCAVGVLSAAVATAVLAGCGGSSPAVVRTSTEIPSSSTPTSTAPTTAPTTPSTTASSGGGQHVTVTPSRDLSATQKVHVRGTGFTPGEPLQIIECAQRGGATGPGDCNLTGMLSATSDASGSVTADLVVVRGPFGANRIVCSSRQKCLVSVTQASLSPTEEADAPITFRGPARTH